MDLAFFVASREFVSASLSLITLAARVRGSGYVLRLMERILVKWMIDL